MKCYVCKSGTLTVSGCHEYCDNCNFSRFIVTENYIDSCVALLGELVSNTKFDSTKALSSFLYESTQTHLPKLFEFVNNIGDATGFTAMMIDGVMSQAINLQIDDATLNAEENNDLVCSCGSTTFDMKTQAELVCTECKALYEYNEETSQYEPYFLCECGCTSFTQDDDSALANCNQCYSLYVHDQVHGIFRRVVR